MNIDSESTIESNEIYNESENKELINNDESDDKNEKVIDNDDEDENEKLIDDDEDENEKLIDDDEDENEVIEEEKKICGYNKFKEEVGKLDVDSFDRTSEYSYETIPEIREEKKTINYLYIISFLIGLFLIYYFYSGNIFITIIELLLNAVFPYIYIFIKLFLIKGKLVEKIKGLKENNK